MQAPDYLGDTQWPYRYLGIFGSNFYIRCFTRDTDGVAASHA